MSKRVLQVQNFLPRTCMTYVIMHDIYIEGEYALSNNHKGMHMLADSTFGPDQPGGFLQSCQFE